MSNIRMYQTEYEDSKAIVTRTFFTDEQGVVLPERTHCIAFDACGGMALPFRDELQPGQRFILKPVHDNYAGAYPAYDVQSVRRIPQEVYERAVARTKDPAVLEELLGSEFQ